METHNQDVASILAKVKEFHEQGEPFRIYHGSTNSTRPSQRQRDRMVDISHLNHVLQVNTDDKFALVEPNVPMDALVQATLAHGLIPPVVMEFPGITVGGGFAGTAGESSSFRHGFFDRTISWIEIVLANGDLETASVDQNSDLLYGAACSFGTLGITTLLKIELIPARTYVQLTYWPIASMQAAIGKIKELTEDPSIDYVDGVLFALDWGVVCAGRLTDEPGARVQCFSHSSDPWFYLHAKDVVSLSTSPTVESVPMADYLFRYDRGAFWTGTYAFEYFVTPFNSFTRRILDYFMHTRVMYRALHHSGHSEKYLIQDVVVPYPHATQFIEYVDKSFGHYPLWLCPIHQRGKSARSPHGPLAERFNPKIPEMMLNFGIWGPGPTDRRAFVEANRRFEHKVLELGGRQWLYAHTYHTKEEFWTMYNHEDYDALRAKCGAEYLPNIYDKVKIEVDREEKAISESWSIWVLALFWRIWPLSGLYGVYKAAVGGEYLLHRQAEWSRQKIKV